MDVRKIRNARFAFFPALALLLVLIAKPGNAQVVGISVSLNGAMEVPPVATNGTATARLRVNTATGAISGTVNFTGLSSPTSAGHIHMGAAGVNGPVVIPLVGGVGVATGSMSVAPGSILLPPQLAALRTNGLYLNIHTSAHIGGEIRGQIIFPAATGWDPSDETAMVQVLSGRFDSLQPGDGLAGLSADGNIFVTKDMNEWMKIPGNFIKIFKGDFNGDLIDDIGGISKMDGSIRITTDFGATWMTVPGPPK